MCQRGAGMNCNWLQDMSRRQTKVFRCSSFSKMLPRCGRAAHICEANYFATSSPYCNCTFLKLSNSQFDCLCKTGYKFGQGNGAIAARWQAKAGGETPFCRTLKTVFSKSRTFRKVFRSNCSTGTVGKYLFSDKVSQGGAFLFAPPRKAIAFLTTPSVCQKHGTEISLPAGSDQGYSPTPRQHF